MRLGTGVSFCLDELQACSRSDLIRGPMLQKFADLRQAVTHCQAAPIYCHCYASDHICED